MAGTFKLSPSRFPAFSINQLQPVLVHGVIPSQIQNLTFPFIVLPDDPSQVAQNNSQQYYPYKLYPKRSWAPLVLTESCLLVP